MCEGLGAFVFVGIDKGKPTVGIDEGSNVGGDGESEG